MAGGFGGEVKLFGNHLIVIFNFKAFGFLVRVVNVGHLCTAEGGVEGRAGFWACCSSSQFVGESVGDQMGAQ